MGTIDTFAARVLPAHEPRVVVITGATSGVGRATAWRFANVGARIALLARGEEALRSTALEVSADGGHPLAIPVDVADHDAVFAAARRVEEELGPIDAWINAASVALFGPADQLPSAELARLLSVDVLGTIHGTQAALAAMRPRNRGVIVQVGSVLAHRGVPLRAAESAAKHAVRGYTDALRAELLHDGIDVSLTMVQLPSVNTPQLAWAANLTSRSPVPLPPVIEPESAADAVVFAAHHPRREVVVGVKTAGLALAQSLAPALVDRWLARFSYDQQLGARTTHAPSEHGPSNLFVPGRGEHASHGRPARGRGGRDAGSLITTRLGASLLRLFFLLTSPLWAALAILRLALTPTRPARS